MRRGMKNISKAKAYSYIRFSTPEQERGDSLRRQTDAAVRYAALHDLELDDKLTFRDLGVSAFRGANEETGRLGEFLAAVHHSDIPKGSFLLVESLDRLSRQKPRKAVKVLERICEAGITVVTLDDGRAYTEETLDEDPMALLVALLVASRAYEESAKKGRRVALAWENKRANAKVKPLTSRAPGWLRLKEDRSGFVLVPERAAIVRRIFEQTLEGRGQHAIAESLNRDGIPVFGRGKLWQRSYIKKMLADASVIGVYLPHRADRSGGKKVRIPTQPVEGYFPPVIDREVFDRVAALSNGRTANTKSGMANILAGLAKCPRCGATMTRVNKGSGPKGGKPYLVCTMAKAGGGCVYEASPCDQIEAAIINYATTFYASAPSADAAFQTEWDNARSIEEGIGVEIDRIVDAIRETGHSPVLLAELRRLEQLHDEAERSAGEAERRASAATTNRTNNTLDKLVAQLNKEERDIATINVTMRQLFEKVVVDRSTGDLWFHWKHAPGETTNIVYAWSRGE